MMDGVIDRWQSRYAEALLEQAKREVEHSKPKLTLRLALGLSLAFIFLATPYAVMAGGALLVIVYSPSVSAIVIGLILIGFGLTLLPRFGKSKAQIYRRSDLPKLFSLLDQISASLNTTAPDGVEFNPEVNAHMRQCRPQWFGGKTEWILGIGLPLWSALTPQERVALLAHEIAHKVNDDPMRIGIFLRAELVLDNWYDTLDMDSGPIDGAGAFVQDLMGLVVQLVQRWLSGLSFFESQRAEYRADAYAVRVAGADAVRSMLEKIACSDLAHRSVIDLYPYKADQNDRIFDHMGAAIAHADDAARERMLALATKEKRRVDTTHPPTVMRIAFATSLTGHWEPGVNAVGIDFAALAAELKPLADRCGAAKMQELYDTEVNR